MLFNSYPFIFLFLPISVVVFFLLGSRSKRLATAWLVIVSLFFYGWWNLNYLALLLISIIINYSIGLSLIKRQQKNSENIKINKRILILGLTFDLALLAYYKYANFFVDNINLLTESNWTIGTIVLPLGISFFTFTQIAFLVDAYRGEVKEYNFLHYVLFITYFPHLISGPIIHHKEIIPQFINPKTFKLDLDNIAVGTTVFFLGLFKKTVLADGIAPHAITFFSVANNGQELTFLEAWLGTITYIFQLYFDFSGYSDMAIGSSLLFGVKLPLNFHSPFKSINIFELWRRWHMTLSRFLHDYVYTPLCHGKQKPWRIINNLVLTMIIGGFWHGAGWNFLLWGGLQGFFLLVNHYWRNARRALGFDIRRSTVLGRAISCALTFASFAFSTALFRTKDLDSAGRMFRGLLGFNGIALPPEWQNNFLTLDVIATTFGIKFHHLNTRITDTGFTSDAFKWTIYLGFIIWCMPNTQQVMSKYFPALTPYAGDRKNVTALVWSQNIYWAITTAFVSIIALANITKVSEFLYYQF